MNSDKSRDYPGSIVPALLTDLYELTMACGYWQSGTADKCTAFHLSFRDSPFGSGFTVAAGLQPVIDYLENFRFSGSDLDYLAGVPGQDKQLLFERGFLKYLRGLRFSCDVDAVPEGTVVFPHEPLVRVEGPILQAQVVETALLNLINFQSLIATKAARIWLAAQGESVIEFGLRRAQGPDGGLSAARAAFIGGCSATSNVLAGKIYGIPLAGTHAHSWVMSFDSELEAFRAYAKAMPHNCILLVDTFDSLEGVRHAIEIGRELRKTGGRLAGIRLDSGDLAFLSIEARKNLDAAGFKDTVIVASNDLDEHIISSLKQQGATITVWGVGTRMVTAHEQPALGGVYKLSAIKNAAGVWEPRLKLSDQVAKVTNPGLLQVRRFYSEKQFLGDAIFDVSRPLPGKFTIVDPLDLTRQKHFPPGTLSRDLLVPVFRGGKRVYSSPPLKDIRQRTNDQLAMLHPGIKRPVNPHQYPAGLELGLYNLKTQLILEARESVKCSRQME
jgi:nicotinate phosphoribosyltransferase